jgi:hypothetical protein
VLDLLDGQPDLPLFDDPVDLVAVRGRGERSVLVADLEQLEGLGEALHSPVPLGLEPEAGPAQRVAGRVGEQRLAAERDRHHPGGGGLGDAVHLQGRRAPGDELGGRLGESDLSDVEPRPGRQRRVEPAQSLVVGERVGDSVRGVFEEQQEAIGLVDLPARWSRSRSRASWSWAAQRVDMAGSPSS